jgi:hypothetical protein
MSTRLLRWTLNLIAALIATACWVGASDTGTAVALVAGVLGVRVVCWETGWDRNESP